MKRITLKHIKSGQIISGQLVKEWFVNCPGWTILTDTLDGQPTAKHELFAQAKCWEKID